MYAVTVIIIRGVSLLSGESGSGDVMDLHDLSVGPVVFRHDPRLMLPSLVYFTDEQVKVTVQYMNAQQIIISIHLYNHRLFDVLISCCVIVFHLYSVQLLSVLSEIKSPTHLIGGGTVQ